MRKAGLTLAAALCFLLPSCIAGPSQFGRSVDDWDNQLYVDSPWLDNFLTWIPVIPLGRMLAAVGDTLIVNPVQFWSDDAWDSDGAAFKHKEAKTKDGEMRSLLMSDSNVLEVYR